MMPEKIVFILSTGRTGTKALAEGLAGDGILSPHQPPFSRPLTIASNYYLHGWLPESALRWLINRVRLSQIRHTNCRYYIQVFSLDHLAAKFISQQYPNVYVIHIVRDPRTFVTSYLNWMHTKFKSFMANKFVLGWQPSGYFTGEIPWRVWRNMDEFQRICWQWVYKNQTLEDLFARSPHYLCLRFEDLFINENKLTTLKSLISFVDIPYQDRFAEICQHKKNSSRKTYFPQWSEWPLDRKKQLLDICGRQMAQYGYPITGEIKGLR
ncbi:sulfotransferase domain-containing protein [Chloroflexota bacterium]